MARALISATHKSSGKTTIAIGLCAALAGQGVRVQPFKKGPDYIDPLWLELAAGRPCRNLDFNTMERDQLAALFAKHAAAADLAVVEGNKGLFDGVDLEGRDSNAALASLLQLPVVLVVDTRGMTRGIAPLILGYQSFGPDVAIAGLILNRVGGARHEGKLRRAVEHYTDVPVIGAVGRHAEIEIPERHLGLVPANEEPAARERVGRIAAIVAAEVEIGRFRDIAANAPTLSPPPVRAKAAPAAARGDTVRVGIARDAAFGFYYPDDLEALEAAGAKVAFFDTLADRHLPDVDGLFIGGGFPETHLAGLEANQRLRNEIRNAIQAGLPVYAECGGLLYLAQSLSWRGERRAMVGVIPADGVVHARPMGRGHVRLMETGTSPWPILAGGGRTEIPAHEFHYAALENLPDDVTFAYEVRRGAGIDGRHDGIVIGNLMASFSHLRHTAENPWAARFVAFVRHVRNRMTGRPAARRRDEPAPTALSGAGKAR